MRNKHGRRTVVIDNVLEDAQFVAQHVELLRHVEPVVEDMARVQQGGQPSLDIGLLVEQLADGIVDVEIRGRARHAGGACLLACLLGCLLPETGDGSWVVFLGEFVGSSAQAPGQVGLPGLRTCCRRRDCRCPWRAPWRRAAERMRAKAAERGQAEERE